MAICLLHSYANPAHERAVAEAVRRGAARRRAVSVSHAILPEIKEYPRTSTTVVNAYVQPVVRAYLTALAGAARGVGITAPLQSDAVEWRARRAAQAAEFPAHIVESGPAAGVVGAAVLAARLGEDRLITFDMGGTTAKAGLVEDGEVLRAEAMEVGAGVMAGARLLVGAGYMLKLPAIDLAEVGAGGGSICALDPAGAPKVGPRSAGADPGPVCYGRGGTEPTITDCNLVLGYLDPAGLAGGAVRLDRAAALQRWRTGWPIRWACARARRRYGMLRLAAATMMRAIRAVSVERGRDVRDFTLLAFGGNGPLFAAAIAAELGIAACWSRRCPACSARSACCWPTPSTMPRARCATRDAAALQPRARCAARRKGWRGWRRTVFRGALRDGAFRQGALWRPVQRAIGEAAGGDAAAILAALPEAFADEHERTYGFRAPPEEHVELMGVSVIARGLPERPHLPDAYSAGQREGAGHPARLVRGRGLDGDAGDRPGGAGRR